MRMRILAQPVWALCFAAAMLFAGGVEAAEVTVVKGTKSTVVDTAGGGVTVLRGEPAKPKPRAKTGPVVVVYAVPTIVYDTDRSTYSLGAVGRTTGTYPLILSPNGFSPAVPTSTISPRSGMAGVPRGFGP